MQRTERHSDFALRRGECKKDVDTVEGGSRGVAAMATERVIAADLCFGIQLRLAKVAPDQGTEEGLASRARNWISSKDRVQSNSQNLLPQLGLTSSFTRCRIPGGHLLLFLPCPVTRGLPLSTESFWSLLGQKLQREKWRCLPQ